MSVHSTDAGRNGLRFRKVFLSQCRWLVGYYPEVSTFAAPVLSIPSYIIIFKLFYINFRESQRHTKPIHNSMLIKIQPDATVCRYLFTAKPLYMFRMSQHPSSGVLKTVTAASVTGHNIGTATSLQRGLIKPRWREVAVPILWPVSEAAVTVFSTPDDGCGDTRNM